jgi:LAO/AO transport system kinase
MNDLLSAILAGDRRALARGLTQVENDSPQAAALLDGLFPYTGRAWVIGMTGAPGTGKSSLVTALAKAYRAQGQTVAILAVDPTSPFTGGAILGDRIRMRDLSGDKGVFIRSMATRGSLGGLARATRDAIRLMDAAGFDRILVETVGAGQSEVDIARAAYTTLVIEAPGLGDDVQAIKAGILEIADVLVVNKADRPGADNTVRALRTMLEIGHPASRQAMIRHHGQMVAAPETPDEANLWIPPVIRTVAIDGQGVDELLEAVENHRTHLALEGRRTALERQQTEIEVYERLREALIQRLLAEVPADAIEAILARIVARTLNPQAAVKALLDQYSQKPKQGA